MTGSPQKGPASRTDFDKRMLLYCLPFLYLAGATTARALTDAASLQHMIFYGSIFVVGSGFWKAMRFFVVSSGIVTIE